MSDPNGPVRVKHKFAFWNEDGTTLLEMKGTIISGEYPRYFVKWDDEGFLAGPYEDEPFHISVLEILSD